MTSTTTRPRRRSFVAAALATAAVLVLQLGLTATPAAASPGSVVTAPSTGTALPGYVDLHRRKRHRELADS